MGYSRGLSKPVAGLERAGVQSGGHARNDCHGHPEAGGTVDLDLDKHVEQPRKNVLP